MAAIIVLALSAGFVTMLAGSADAAGPRLSVATSSLPRAVVLKPYSKSLAAKGGKGRYSWRVSSGRLPAGLKLSAAGRIAGTPTTKGTRSFTVRVSDSSKPTKKVASRRLTILVGPMTVTTTRLPSGQVGTVYPSTTLAASGGKAPRSWSVVSGNLPSGLRLASGGVLAGTPTATGASTITVKVIDATRTNTATRTLSIAISPPISPPVSPPVSPLTVTTDDVPVGKTGIAYSGDLRANGGLGIATWALAGGTLPPGLTLTPTGVLSGEPTTTGNYPIVLEASDSSTPKLTARAAFTISIVTPDHTGPVVIDHCGTLTLDESWTGTRVHHLTCPVVVPAGITLTARSGAVVKADPGAGIVVSGRLASPTTNGAATFTSWQDDTAAGDSNGDGSATAPAPGGWDGITTAVEWRDPAASIDVHGIDLRYAGLSINNNAAWNGVPNYVPPTMSITGSTFAHGSFVDVDTAGPVVITGNTVTSAAGAEEAHVTNAIHVVQWLSYPTTVSDNTVNGSTSCGIYVGTATYGAGIDFHDSVVSPVVRDNVVRSQREPICVSSGAIRQEGLTGNTSSNTAYRAIRLAGTARTNLTAPIGSLPVTLGSDEHPELSSILSAEGLTIDSGTTFTIAAGGIVRAYDQVGLIVNGGLKTDGTPEAPATFTDIHDDAAGDYEGDGTATSPQAFDWTGISAAGGDARPVSVDVDGLTLRYAPLTVTHDSTDEQNSPGSTVSVTNSTFEHGARLQMTNTGPITVTGNTVTNATSAELFRTYQAILVTQRGKQSTTNVSANTVTGAIKCGIQVDTTAATALSPVVTDNSARSDGEPVCVNSNQLRAENLTGNTSTNTAHRGLLLSGRLISDITLPLGELPITIGSGGSAWGTWGLTTAPGTTMTVNAGAIVKGYENSGGLTVNGALVVDGTAASPATFTSTHDDAVGGDYEGDGSASTPTPGKWGGIAVVNGLGDAASISATHLAMRYAPLTASMNYTAEDQAPMTSVTDSTFQFGSKLAVAVNGPIAVAGNSVLNTNAAERSRAANGIQVNQNGHLSPTAVKGNQVNGAQGCGVFVMTGSAHTESPVVEDNAATSDREPVCVYSNELRGENLTGNSSTNANYRGIALGGRLVSDLAVPLDSLPLTLGNVGSGYTDSNWLALGLNVDPGITLSVGAGSVIKSQLPADSGWVGPSTLTVNGVLNANGTADAPVTFTSPYDDTVGGDYQGNGPARAPKAGDWGGIKVGPAGQSNFTYTQVLYAP
jgi:Putative Ig domain